MILGFIALWIFALTMVGSLCVAARLGDVAQCAGEETLSAREHLQVADDSQWVLAPDTNAGRARRAEQVPEMTGAREAAA